MSILHHPDSALLLAYASGDLKTSSALLIATHLALCPPCRKSVSDAEVVGGVYLDSIRPEPVNDNALRDVLRRLDDSDAMNGSAKTFAASPQHDHFIDGVRLPDPLRSWVDRPTMKSLEWNKLGFGIERIDLTGDSDVVATVMRIDPGRAMPRHGHNADEQTLVLSGGFSDEFGHFGPGDIECADEHVVHRPVADGDEPCVCLVVADAPIQLVGPFGKFLQPLVRF